MNGGRRSARHRARLTARLVSAGTVMALLLGVVYAGTAQAAPSNVKKTFTSTTPVQIPDWSEPVEGEIGQAASVVSVSGLLGNITKVSVSVYITHGATSELDAALIGPDLQTYAYLFSVLPSNGTSFGTSCADGDRTTFDDGAASSIDAGTSPFVGTFRPQDSLNFPLSNFNGGGFTGDGDWYFDVFDYEQGNTGNIECWSLFIETDQGQSLRFDNDTPVQLGDATDASGGGVATSDIDATGLAQNVTGVTVSVWITHAQDSDLDVILVSPSGEEVKLAARVGGNGNDFGKSCSKPTVFDDAAKTAIAAGTAPFVGTFKPSEPLAALKGSPANGEWTLKVADNVVNKVGQINCWSLTVASSAASPTPTGVILTPRLTAPQPLPGTFNYPYFTIQNNTADTMTNVTLTGLLPPLLTSDVREDPINFPASCDLNNTQFTCTWESIAPGQTVFGGVLAKVGTPTKNNQKQVCLEGSVTATGLSAVKASSCFTFAAYPEGDRGTGYDVGDIAHDIVLPNEDGDLTALSDYAGKYVLLQFTSVWCGPSNFEVPQDRDEIAALNDANAMGVEVVFLTVLLDGPTPGVPSTKTHALNWINKFDLTTPVLWTANDEIRSAVQQHLTYTIVEGQPQAAVPTSIFIRPDGTIFGVRVGVEPEGGTTDRFLADLP